MRWFRARPCRMTVPPSWRCRFLVARTSSNTGWRPRRPRAVAGGARCQRARVHPDGSAARQAETLHCVLCHLTRTGARLWSRRITRPCPTIPRRRCPARSPSGAGRFPPRAEPRSRSRPSPSNPPFRAADLPEGEGTLAPRVVVRWSKGDLMKTFFVVVVLACGAQLPRKGQRPWRGGRELVVSGDPNRRRPWLSSRGEGKTGDVRPPTDRSRCRAWRPHLPPVREVARLLGEADRGDRGGGRGGAPDGAGRVRSCTSRRCCRCHPTRAAVPTRSSPRACCRARS